MTESLYELTFYSRLVDGVSLETAKANVATLFKASPAQVEKMFMGGRVVIRNKLDKTTAGKYVAVMRKNGLVCETEPMRAAEPSEIAAGNVDTGKVSATPTQRKPEPAPIKTAPSAISSATAVPQKTDMGSTAESPAAAASVDVSSSKLEVLPNPPIEASLERTSAEQEFNAKINLAGEGVDTILQQSHLGLDPEGVRLSEHEELEAPVFSNLESITVAEAGSVLVDKKDEVPVIVPDTSSISIAAAGSDMGQIKKDESIVVPDISHLVLDEPK